MADLRLNDSEKLDRTLPAPEEKQANRTLDTAVSHTPSVATTASHAAGIAKRVMIKTNAHQDDIHGMIPVGPKTFVTGSKDGSLKLWNTDGELVRVVWSPKVRNYNGWITALTPFGSNLWMSGTRNGYIDLWQNDGTHSRTLSGAVRTTPGIKCKSRNMNRINCLAQDLLAEERGQYYVGIATQFSLHRTDEEKSLGQCTTSQNDWVYCIRPLADRKVMVVTGPNLDVFTYDQKLRKWLAEGLIAEGSRRSSENHQRPFISDVIFLTGHISMCALAVFGGAVVVFDPSTKTTVREYREHKKRVWQVVNIRPNILASSSDDRTIKIWDVRLAQSVKTIGGHIGRVSTLLSMSDGVLISGSCPDDLQESEEKARLEFWDIRKL